jgi:hypothetical protein
VAAAANRLLWPGAIVRILATSDRATRVPAHREIAALAAPLAAAESRDSST